MSSWITLAAERLLGPVLRPLERLFVFLRKRGFRRTVSRLSEELGDWALRRFRGGSRYERWFAAQQQLAAEAFLPVDQTGPQISVLMPVCDPEPRWLAAAIDSVRLQHYTDWQLCMVDDASTRPEIRSMLEAAAASDSRIIVEYNQERVGISTTSNRALERAEGEWVALLDHDDELTPDALLHVARSAREQPFDILYSDEDKLGPRGGLRDPVFKPDRCRDFLHACMYFGHLTVYRRGFVDALGGFDPTYDGSQDYELALRAEAVADTVVHLPKVLYHWRMAEGSAANPDQDAKPWAYAAGRRALEAHLKAHSDRASIEEGVGRGHARIRRAVRPGARLSILYCECCQAEGFPPEQLQIGDDAGMEVEWRPISASSGPQGMPVGARWNAAAAEAKGDLLVFLSGVRPQRRPGGSSWEVEVAAQLQRTSVGVVGAQICSAQGKLLHAGVVIGGEEAIRTETPGLVQDEPGHLALAQSIRSVSAVTGGFLGIRRVLLEEMGGFDAVFREGLHDVDLCLRMGVRAERVLYDPYLLLERVNAHGSESEAALGVLARPSPADFRELALKWPDLSGVADRFSSPNFHSTGPVFHPAFRPPGLIR